MRTDDGFWYLATPYSKHPRGRGEAFGEACRETARLLEAGVFTFSPIAHTHPIAELCELPTGFDFWEQLDRVMIDRSAGLIVCELESWAQSEGLTREIEYARAIGKPVIHMMPGHVPTALLENSA